MSRSNSTASVGGKKDLGPPKNVNPRTSQQRMMKREDSGRMREMEAYLQSKYVRSQRMRGISRARDSREIELTNGGAEQCFDKVTTDDEFGGKGSDERLGPAVVNEKQGHPKMTQSG